MAWQTDFVVEATAGLMGVFAGVMVREHAKLGGFPCNNVTRIEDVIDPTTAET